MHLDDEIDNAALQKLEALQRQRMIDLFDFDPASRSRPKASKCKHANSKAADQSITQPADILTPPEKRRPLPPHSKRPSKDVESKQRPTSAAPNAKFVTAQCAQFPGTVTKPRIILPNGRT